MELASIVLMERTVPATLFSLLKSCRHTKSLKQIQSVHQKIIQFGLHNHNALCKSLTNLYISCHSYKSANSVFFSSGNTSDISLWNALIAAHTKNNLFSDSLSLFDDLLHFPDLKPDSFTYPSVLKACAGLKRVDFGEKTHAQLVKIGSLSDVFVASSLMNLYIKCGVFGLAVKVFDDMPQRDLACWNNVISCYYQSGEWEKALECFEGMKSAGFGPDSVSFTIAISSCGRLLDLERGVRVHEEARSGIGLDGYISNALVDMYGKCGCIERAKDVFDGVGEKSLVCWNAMIGGYSQMGDSLSCIELLAGMRYDKVWPSSTTIRSLFMACAKSAQILHGKFIHGYLIRNNIGSEIYVDSSLVDFYFKCGSISLAEKVFKLMPKSDIVAWNVMVSGYVSVGRYFEALRIYDCMKEAGLRPNAFTVTSALTACSQLAALDRGKELHSDIIESRLDFNQIVMGALLDMYSKCGALDEAAHIFNQLPARDLVSWTSMIVAFGSHGQAFEAIKLFDEMLQTNLRPDRVTFLAIISSCSHAGLVNEGQYYFNLMSSTYGIQPTTAEHSCLIDLLCRAGRIHDAYEILQKDSYIAKDADILSTLFAACHMHGELELAEKLSNLLIEMNLDDPSTYVVQEKMYATTKKWDEARKIRFKMKEMALKKNPGRSWIEIGKGIQSFVAADTEFAGTEPVYDCLSLIYGQMAKSEIVDRALSL